MIPPSALANAGLQGWKSSFHNHPNLTDHRVCVLTSPDYCPVRKTGHMVASSAVVDEIAFRHAIKSAKDVLRGQTHH